MIDGFWPRKCDSNDGKTLQASSGRCGCIPCVAKRKFQPIQEIQAPGGVCVCVHAQASLEETDQCC